MRQLVRKRRRSRRPPLDEDLILSWADEHFEQFGAWPNLNSGPVTYHDGEHWARIDKALRRGYRGLLLGSSLAILLSERRGVINRRGRPNFTVENILFWADHHLTIYGRYPFARDGIIDLAPTETWCAVNMALCDGCRGLPGDSSLSQLLQAHRGKRNSSCLPKFSQALILEWADEHYQRTGSWPVAESGGVRAAPGEIWASVDFSLRRGTRGLPGGISLAALLIHHRGKRDKYNAPISIETITTWMRLHAARHAKYPTCDTGVVEDAPEEHWGSLQTALRVGHRGLPGGSTLAKLKQRLILEGKLRNHNESAPYSLTTITVWMKAYTIHHGSYPTTHSGIIEEAPGENWKKVDNALRQGLRGLPGGSTLAKLRQELIRDGKL